MVKALRFVLREPANAWLALNIGVFILSAHRRLARQSVPRFISGLRRNGIVRIPRAPRERIVRFRNWWLQKPALRKCDTCYVRAMTLYRFLDAPDCDLALHIGIETRENTNERLRGHAWISLGGELLEGPQAVAQGRIREIDFSKGLRR
jgi:hypothetical protein